MIFSVNVVAFCDGTGTVGDPYLICTADQLNNTRLNLSAHYKLNNSIDMDVAYQTLSLQLIYLMGEEPQYCEFYSSELKKIELATEQVGYELSLLEESKGYTNPELKNKYFLLETTSFTVHRRIGEICGSDSKEVLYFYSNELCGEDCVVQGRELLKLKEKEDVRIYSFDCTIDSPIANSLCKKYNVKSYPTIVTNENIFVGLNKYNELLEKI